MKIIFRGIFLLLFLKHTLTAFSIDPFPKHGTLIDNFSTNCLQMTQSQQMLKAYVMVGLKSNFQNPKKHLQKAIGDYDKRMLEVREYFQKLLIKPSDEPAKKAFDEALKLWQDSKKRLKLPPTKQNALIIKDNFQTMINKLLEGTKPLATPELELISLTGKLCRKPVEITIDYLLRIWGVDIVNYKQDVKQIITNFHTNLTTLQAHKLNNDESHKLLNKARKQFMFFEIMYKAKKIFIPSLLSKKADDNFLIIRQIKSIFKKQARQL